MDKKITFYKWIGKKFLKWINLIFCAVADGQIGDDDAQVNHDEQKSEHPEPQTGLKTGFNLFELPLESQFEKSCI